MRGLQRFVTLLATSMPDKGLSATDAGATNDSSTPDDKVVEGLDYYWEGPLMVFTAHYLLRRGYCCERGCRHCPYQFETGT